VSRQRTPDRPPPPPVVQRIRLRYAKRGRLRFTSHRDVARAFERAIRRAQLPIGFSAGFSPHPKISWVGAAPTGVASEAEYVEIGLAEPRAPDEVRAALDDSLPEGIDILEAVEARTSGFPDRVTASAWRVRIPGAEAAAVRGAVEGFLAADAVPVQRRTKDGSRTLDARAAVVALSVVDPSADPSCVILDLVVRHLTPAVRPDDVLAGLVGTTGLTLPAPFEATRLAQGLLGADGAIADPLEADRTTT
jgi:radical SAM-linked protein